MLIGVDGCPAGWIVAAQQDISSPVAISVVKNFAALIETLPQLYLIAVDMPIGLPDRITGGGRTAERAVRSLLGQQRSSVFAIPARAAVYAVEPQPQGMLALLAGHRAASAVAKEHSEPPRGISFQAFNLFPKIREIDGLLRRSPDLASSLHETHPEVAFWQMNGGKPLAAPKKLNGKVNPVGLAERRRLLLATGLPDAAVMASAPRGAGLDDLIDALACLVVARRIRQGMAQCFPDPPEVDPYGIPIAIRA